MKFWPILLRAALLLLTVSVTTALIAGFLGYLHPALDSFSHFRVHLAVALAGCAVLLFAVRYRANALVALLLAVGALASTGQYPLLRMQTAKAVPDAEKTYTLLQINLRWDHRDPGRVLSLIRTVKPDILTLDEVSPMWTASLAALSSDYPFRTECTPRSFGSVVLSRRPFLNDRATACHGRGTLAVATVDLDGRPVEIGAVHLLWPWPFRQGAQIDRLANAFSQFGETAIIAGDFNAATWSHSVRRVAALANMKVVSGIGPTWITYRLPRNMLWAGLPIDNIMYKGDVIVHSARTLEDAGSDHWPVLLEFSLRNPNAMQAMATE